MTTSDIGRNINILLLYCGVKKRRLYFTNSTSVHVVVIKNVALKSADSSATQDGCLLITVRLDTIWTTASSYSPDKAALSCVQSYCDRSRLPPAMQTETSGFFSSTSTSLRSFPSIEYVVLGASLTSGSFRCVPHSSLSSSESLSISFTRLFCHLGSLSLGPLLNLELSCGESIHKNNVSEKWKLLKLMYQCLVITYVLS